MKNHYYKNHECFQNICFNSDSIFKMDDMTYLHMPDRLKASILHMPPNFQRVHQTLCILVQCYHSVAVLWF